MRYVWNRGNFYFKILHRPSAPIIPVSFERALFQHGRHFEIYDTETVIDHLHYTTDAPQRVTYPITVYSVSSRAHLKQLMTRHDNVARHSRAYSTSSTINTLFNSASLQTSIPPLSSPTVPRRKDTMKHLSIIALLAACTLTAGVTILECSCSPSKRGFRRGVLTELTQSRAALKALSADLWAKARKDKSITPGYVQAKVSETAVSLWKGCISNWNSEECVNADVQLRLCKGKCDRDSFCRFNGNNWRNILDGQEVPGCDESPLSSSTNDQIIKGIPDFATPIRPSNSPTPSPSKQVAIPIPSRKPFRTPKPETSSAVESDKASKSGDTEEPVDQEVEIDMEPSASPYPETLSASGTPSSIAATANEGCVAVEHLEGYVLQHPQHLLRPVLCAEGFCATPNHAIIVDGVWTSMKRLCRTEWQCVRSVKLVNNIKARANSRVNINSRIVVTPYDLRFPTWCVWVVQLLEDTVNRCDISGITCGIAALAVLVATQLRRVSE